jgi:hypothetical protein
MKLQGQFFKSECYVVLLGGGEEVIFRGQGVRTPAWES